MLVEHVEGKEVVLEGSYCFFCLDFAEDFGAICGAARENLKYG